MGRPLKIKVSFQEAGNISRNAASFPGGVAIAIPTTACIQSRAQLGRIFAGAGLFPINA
jgi:hypothetical protein